MTERIYQENSRLKYNERVNVSNYDDHLLHILIHSKLLEKKNHGLSSEVIKTILKHIEMHTKLLKQVWSENNS